VERQGGTGGLDPLVLIEHLGHAERHRRPYGLKMIMRRIVSGMIGLELH
jgi:hypothetical protein